MENYEYLQHAGVKGMKWGVRRYQNADGSLTDAGRKRYGSGSDSSIKSFMKNRAAKKQAKEAEAKKQARLEAMRKGKETKQKQAEEEANRAAATEAKKKEVLASRSAKNLYENAHLFSNEELSAAYYRLTLERNISQLAPREISKGQQFVDKMDRYMTNIDKMAKGGTNLYNHAARIHNSLGDGDKWPLIKDNDQKKGGNNNSGGKKKDKGNNNNQNQNQNNSGKKNDKNGKDNSGKKDDKSNQNDSGKSDKKNKQNKTDTKTEKTERYEGKPEDIIGEGKSKSSIKNGDDWVKKSYADWDVVAHTPATVERGETYVNRLLSNEEEYMRWYLD